MQRRLAMYASPTLTPRWAYPDGDGGGGGGGGDDAAAKAAAEKAAADKAAADKEAAAKSATDTDTGFPKDTPIAEMTVDQREAYWKHQARKHENTAKARSDYDDLKAKAEQFDALSAASRTEQEQAIETAKAEARAEAIQATAPSLVRAEMRAEAKGRMPDDQISDWLETVTEPLDLTKFLTDKGEVDTAKVSEFIGRIAPAGSNGRVPDLGQGRRGSGGKTSGVSAGKDMYAESHGKS